MDGEARLRASDRGRAVDRAHAARRAVREAPRLTRSSSPASERATGAACADNRLITKHRICGSRRGARGVGARRAPRALCGRGVHSVARRRAGGLAQSHPQSPSAASHCTRPPRLEGGVAPFEAGSVALAVCPAPAAEAGRGRRSRPRRAGPRPPLPASARRASARHVELTFLVAARSPAKKRPLVAPPRRATLMRLAPDSRQVKGGGSPGALCARRT